MATIDDVAKLAGVGRTTVSHALSGKRHVAAATRARILSVVQELGYQPNAAARSLVSRRTMTVALIVPLDLNVLSDNRSTEFIVAVGDRLNTHGYRLLCLVDRNPGADDVRILVQSGQVDGALLLQVRADDPRVDVLKSEGRPFVAIGRPRETSGLLRVDADFERAAELAVDHLFSLGHGTIGFLSSGHNGTPIFGFQWYSLVGFRRALRAHRKPFTREHVLLHSQETRAELERALAPLLDGTLPLTALVTTTFIEAAIVMAILAEHGWRVPQDISLVALGDPRATVLPLPSITVVRFSADELSRTAVDLLVDTLEGRQPARAQRLVPVELVVRGSTGHAAAAAQHPVVGLPTKGTAPADDQFPLSVTG